MYLVLFNPLPNFVAPPSLWFLLPLVVSGRLWVLRSLFYVGAPRNNVGAQILGTGTLSSAQLLALCQSSISWERCLGALSHQLVVQPSRFLLHPVQSVDRELKRQAQLDCSSLHLGWIWQSRKFSIKKRWLGFGRLLEPGWSSYFIRHRSFPGNDPLSLHFSNRKTEAKPPRLTSSKP